MSRGRSLPLLPLLFCCLGAGRSAAQEPEEKRFRLGGEFKTDFRDSSLVQYAHDFPVAPNRIVTAFLATPAPNPAFELSNLALRGEGELSSLVSAKIEIHILDLHNRNPTSSDNRVFVREAWVRFGSQPEGLDLFPGTTAYVLLGQAPRFSKQLTRRLESYGLWGTSVGRFEMPQVQAGGTVGRHVYWRLHAASGNPLFYRDPNALAGDNGTPERAQGSTVPPVFGTGFAILYDAKATDLNFNSFEWGGGVGARWAREKGPALDVLAWRFDRNMADTARVPGSSFPADLGILRGVTVPLPFQGRHKSETGLNVQGRAGGFRLFGQFVDQDIAKLVRGGVELEAAYVVDLGGLFAIGDTPVGRWVQPVVRFSNIDNRFVTPDEYPEPAVGWNWRKWDIGVRVGIVPGVDLTAEYARNDMMVRPGPTLHPDETLLTLRVGF